MTRRIAGTFAAVNVTSNFGALRRASSFRDKVRGLICNSSFQHDAFLISEIPQIDFAIREDDEISAIND